MKKHRNNNFLLCIVGPTASGKTALAVELAYLLNGEILSADSRQVYTNMDLGTGKDLTSYLVKGKKIPHHLINIRPPGYKYNVYEYQQDFHSAFKEIITRKKQAILCGGSGLYIEAVLNKYNLLQVPVNEHLRNSLKNKSLAELKLILTQYKKLHNVSDIDTRKRAIRAIEIEKYYHFHPLTKVDFPDFTYRIFGIKYPREILKKNITYRLHKRIEQGLILEVRKLLKTSIIPADLLYYGLEYKYITLYLENKLNYEEMMQQLTTAIHRFAKRQMTWFRRMERNNFSIHWLEGTLSLEDKVKEIISTLEK